MHPIKLQNCAFSPYRCNAGPLYYYEAIHATINSICIWKSFVNFKKANPQCQLNYRFCFSKGSTKGNENVFFLMHFAWLLLFV